ncbi:MAG: hypothetical protein WAT39_18020 [Planctomycetota bacterium]
MSAPATPSVPRGGWLTALPLLLTVAVLSALLLPRAQANAGLFWSIAGTGGALVLWQVALWVAAARSGRALALELLPPSRQHYIQACVQTCLYVYWGYWWQQDGARPIYVQAPLILVQFAFLYAFDALLSWTRGRPWRLSSGPTPIVLSTNLFIWFKDDWFVWQFAMVAAGLLGKEFLKWTKEGRRTHVFNPSGFGLLCAATALIVTGATEVTWAKPLATTIEVPGIFVFLFGLGLVVQHFFAVTLMTFAAAVAMVGCNLLYTQVTGVYLFASSNLPAAAFLGLHLLMTDPSTSPRSNVGRLLFGAGYGVGYVVAFEVLGALGAPELYAKLYPVPILNCCVQWLDRLARGPLGRLEQRWQQVLPAKWMNAAHMAGWASVFAVLIGTGYLQGPHPGNSIAFWKRAVAERRHDAERKLVMVAGSQAIATQSGDAYNELGILAVAGSADPASAATRHKSAAEWFARGAARGSHAAVENIVAHFLWFGRHRSDQELDQALRAIEAMAGKPGGERAALLLGLAHETGGARPLDPGKALDLYRRWPDEPFAQRGIARIGLQPGAVVDLTKVAPTLTVAATAGSGECCWYLAYMYELGRGVVRDPERARSLFARAVELGFPPALEAKQQAGTAPGLPPFQPPRRKVLEFPGWSTAFPVGG